MEASRPKRPRLPRKLYPDQIVVVLGMRSQMLADGDEPRVLVGKHTDALMLARLELAQGVCPIELRDPVTLEWFDPNELMTPDDVEFLRLGYLSDFPEIEAQVDNLFIHSPDWAASVGFSSLMSTSSIQN
jgi:hypothetical protein